MDFHRQKANKHDAMHARQQKHKALSVFSGIHGPHILSNCQVLIITCISVLSWTSITPTAAPCSEHIFSTDWNLTENAQKNWNPFSPLFWSTVHSISNYARRTRTLKAKACYVAFVKLSSFPPHIKTQTVLKPQSHIQKKLLVVS